MTSMLDSGLLKYEVRAWSFSFACNGDDKPDRRRLSLKLTYFGDPWDVILSTKELLGQLPADLNLLPGEAITGTGKLNGCGYFNYRRETEDLPVNVGGWAALPAGDFDRLWTLLSLPSGLMVTVKLWVGPLPFEMPDSHAWNVESEPHLLIRELDCSLQSPGWHDET